MCLSFLKTRQRTSAPDCKIIQQFPTRADVAIEIRKVCKSLPLSEWVLPLAPEAGAPASAAAANAEEYVAVESEAEDAEQ